MPTGQAHIAPPRDVEKCQTVYDFPDNGYALCYNLEDSSCTVYAYRTTFIGTEKDCIVPDAEASAAPGAPSTAPPDLSEWPECQFAQVGYVCTSPYWPGCNVWIVWTAIPAQPTCLYRSDPLLMSAGAETPPCFEVYSETHLAGPYWLVRRNSCSAQVYECPDGYDPPAPPCREVGLEAQAAIAPPQVDPSLPPMNCYDIYSRREVGPVAVVMTSSCSGHVEVCDEPVTLDRTGLAQSVDTSCADDYLPVIYCQPWTSETDIGPATIEVGGCGADVELCNDSLLDGRTSVSCLVSPLTASSQEPQCLYYYWEREVGPVRVVQRDSCHQETYVCGQDSREFTEIGAPQPDEATLQRCVRETVDKYIALG